MEITMSTSASCCWCSPRHRNPRSKNRQRFWFSNQILFSEIAVAGVDSTFYGCEEWDWLIIVHQFAIHNFPMVNAKRKWWRFFGSWYGVRAGHCNVIVGAAIFHHQHVDLRLNERVMPFHAKLIAKQNIFQVYSTLKLVHDKQVRPQRRSVETPNSFMLAVTLGKFLKQRAKILGLQRTSALTDFQQSLHQWPFWCHLNTMGTIMAAATSNTSTIPKPMRIFWALHIEWLKGWMLLGGSKLLKRCAKSVTDERLKTNLTNTNFEPKINFSSG